MTHEPYALILISKKGDTVWRNALKSQPLLPVADLDSKMEHLNSRFEVLFKSLAELRSEGNLEEFFSYVVLKSKKNI